MHTPLIFHCFKQLRAGGASWRRSGPTQSLIPAVKSYGLLPTAVTTFRNYFPIGFLIR